MKRHLVIMAKEPRLGRVKTRLGREIGHVRAWTFYRRQLLSLPKGLKGPWQVWLSITPDNALKRCFFPQSGVQFMGQDTGNLGQRMLYPSKKLPIGPYVLVGTDVPEIRAHHIRKAFRLLGHHDVVFGPATDGGFWLVGHKRHPKMVSPYGPKPVRWSHPETLQDCLKNLKGDKVALIETLSDVDDRESYENFTRHP